MAYIVQPREFVENTKQIKLLSKQILLSHMLTHTVDTLYS